MELLTILLARHRGGSRDRWFFHWPLIGKTLRIMQLTAIFLLAFLMQVAAHTSGQQVTLSVKNASLQEVLQSIKKQTDYTYIAQEDLLEKANKITVNLKNVSVAEALKACFVNQPFKYSLEGKIIIIESPAPTAVTDGLNHQLLSPSLTAPPPITVRGRIVNENGEPVIASVIIKGTNRGTASDADGNFELNNIEGSALLIISGANIETQEIKVNGRNNINIGVRLRIDESEAVTVSTGYWTTTKQRNTGSIFKVTSKDIEKQPMTSPLLALQGRVPGLDISPQNGAPGAAPTIKIRGENSLRTAGAISSDIGTYPLYVIDGLVVDSRPLQSQNSGLSGFYDNGGVDPLIGLGPENIESIEILKDAGATAIYGSQGANGVILITTKKGYRQNKTSLDLSIYKGAGKMPRYLDILNTQEYLQMRKEAFAATGSTPGQFDFDLTRWDSTRDIDWQKVLLGGTTAITDIHLGFSGGSALTNFRLNGGFYKETAILPGDFGYRRITGSFNFNHKTANDRLNVTFIANYGKSINSIASESSLFEAALKLPPNAPELYNADGSLNWDTVDFGFFTINALSNNPMAQVLRTTESNTGFWVVNSNISYKILPGLKFNTTFGFTETNSDEVSKNPIAAQPYSLYSNGRTGVAFFLNNKRNTWQIEPQLNFLRTKNKHRYEAFAGLTFRSTYNSFQAIQATGYSSDVLLNTLKGATSWNYKTDEEFKYRYSAIYGRFHYNYDEKYLVDLTVRRDGSSRFGTNNKFGNFGAVAAGWIFTGEKFVSDNFRFLSFGKLRSSYGITASDNIGDYKYYDLFNISDQPYANSLTLIPGSLFNPNFQWERTRKFEVALELGMVNNKITFEASWYRNISSNQLVDYQLPTTTGFYSVLKNFEATIQNTGWEFVIASKNIIAKNFQWTTSVNVSIPRNKLVSFPNIESSPYKNNFKVGEPLSALNLFRWEGVNPATGEHIIADLNNDGAIDDQNDRIFVKGLDPKYYGGLSNSITYKSFNLSFLFQFSDRLNYNVFNSYPGLTRENQPTLVLSHWQKPGDITNIGKYSNEFSYGNFFGTQVLGSNYNIVNAFFIKLKTLSVSYVFPAGMIAPIKLSECVLFVQGQNLLTFTKYDGIDPETGPRTLPQLRMVTVGLKMKF